MQPRVMYIEQKTENGRSLHDTGPSWKTEVTFSRTGKTIYALGKTFERIRKGGWIGNYFCLEDSYPGRYGTAYDEYWISGVKKRGSNRHPAAVGAGRVKQLDK